MPRAARSRRLAPRPLLLALEAPRAALEAQSLAPTWPLLAGAPRGDGHAVLVLPGFTASDRSTVLLRAYLRGRGYDAVGWELGRNDGQAARLLPALRERLRLLAAASGARVSLVGWSLGGIFARELAKESAQLVRQVITLASPFGDAAADRGPDGGSAAARGELGAPPPVPSTAVYSRSDGVVDWRACREAISERTDNIEIVASHCGLGAHPLAWFAVADRLALPTDGWKPFDRSGWRGALYR